MLIPITALPIMLTKSLVPLFATDVRGRFDATVVMAGLLSYIGLFRYIWWPQRMASKRIDAFRRGTAVAEEHFETADHLQQGIAARPARSPIARSTLVRRLVLAKDDPAKQRIRAQLSDIDDEQLFRFGLTSDDIAALRGASPPAEANIAQGLDQPSKDDASHISPSIAAVLDEKDDVWHRESTMPRRERVSRMQAG